MHRNALMTIFCEHLQIYVHLDFFSIISYLSIFPFIYAVLRNIWSLRTQCSRLSGGLSVSIGYLLVAKPWLVMRPNFTGFMLYLCNLFYLEYGFSLLICVPFLMLFAGFPLFSWHLMCSLLYSVSHLLVLSELLFVAVYHASLQFYMLWRIR